MDIGFVFMKGLDICVLVKLQKRYRNTNETPSV